MSTSVVLNENHNINFEGIKILEAESNYQKRYFRKSHILLGIITIYIHT